MEQLRSLLDEKLARYNCKGFIENDPVSFPHSLLFRLFSELINQSFDFPQRLSHPLGTAVCAAGSLRQACAYYEGAGPDPLRSPAYPEKTSQSAWAVSSKRKAYSAHGQGGICQCGCTGPGTKGSAGGDIPDRRESFGTEAPGKAVRRYRRVSRGDPGRT